MAWNKINNDHLAAATLIKSKFIQLNLKKRSDFLSIYINNV